MKPLYLIRHAEGEHEINESIGWWSDTELTSHGKSQARALAARLKKELQGKETVLYSSPLKRALQTAYEICNEFKITPIVLDDLREYQTGLQSDLSVYEARKIAHTRTIPIKDWKLFENAETFGELYGRAGNVLSRILENHQEIVIIVSHGWLLDKMLAWWIGINDVDIMPNIFVSSNACIHELGLTKQNTHLILRLNDTYHLHY